MTPEEERAWVQMLGSTRERQMATIRELLRYAHTDDMSAEDRTICRRQYQRLAEANEAPARELGASAHV